MSQSRASPIKPALRLAKRLINIEWLSMSKADDISRKTIMVPISLARISLLILARAVSVLYWEHKHFDESEVCYGESDDE